MNPVYIEAVSVLGPGLPNWETLQAVLGGRHTFTYERTPPVQCG